MRKEKNENKIIFIDLPNNEASSSLDSILMSLHLWPFLGSCEILNPRPALKSVDYFICSLLYILSTIASGVGSSDLDPAHYCGFGLAFDLVDYNVRRLVFSAFYAPIVHLGLGENALSLVRI